MSAPLKTDYPAIIAAAAPRIPSGATETERQAIEDGDAVASLLIFLERHGGCGGWSFDPAADTLRCNCGGLAFEIRVPGAAQTGAAA